MFTLPSAALFFSASAEPRVRPDCTHDSSCSSLSLLSSLAPSLVLVQHTSPLSLPPRSLFRRYVTSWNIVLAAQQETSENFSPWSTRSFGATTGGIGSGGDSSKQKSRSNSQGLQGSPGAVAGAATHLLSLPPWKAGEGAKELTSTVKDGEAADGVKDEGHRRSGVEANEEGIENIFDDVEVNKWNDQRQLSPRTAGACDAVRVRGRSLVASRRGSSGDDEERRGSVKEEHVHEEERERGRVARERSTRERSARVGGSEAEISSAASTTTAATAAQHRDVERLTRGLAENPSRNERLSGKDNGSSGAVAGARLHPRGTAISGVDGGGGRGAAGRGGRGVEECCLTDLGSSEDDVSSCLSRTTANRDGGENTLTENRGLFDKDYATIADMDRSDRSPSRSCVSGGTSLPLGSGGGACEDRERRPDRRSGSTQSHQVREDATNAQGRRRQRPAEVTPAMCKIKSNHVLHTIGCRLKRPHPPPR